MKRADWHAHWAPKPPIGAPEPANRTAEWLLVAAIIVGFLYFVAVLVVK